MSKLNGQSVQEYIDDLEASCPTFKNPAEIRIWLRGLAEAVKRELGAKK